VYVLELDSVAQAYAVFGHGWFIWCSSWMWWYLLTFVLVEQPVCPLWLNHIHRAHCTMPGVLNPKSSCTCWRKLRISQVEAPSLADVPGQHSPNVIRGCWHGEGRWLRQVTPGPGQLSSVDSEPIKSSGLYSCLTWKWPVETPAHHGGLLSQRGFRPCTPMWKVQHVCWKGGGRIWSWDTDFV
jgi:hypothetical protein